MTNYYCGVLFTRMKIWKTNSHDSTLYSEKKKEIFYVCNSALWQSILSNLSEIIRNETSQMRQHTNFWHLSHPTSLCTCSTLPEHSQLTYTKYEHKIWSLHSCPPPPPPPPTLLVLIGSASIFYWKPDWSQARWSKLFDRDKKKCQQRKKKHAQLPSIMMTELNEQFIRNWAAARDFQQFDILTSVDSDEPL